MHAGSLHKLTAGSGYDYLPRQVAPMDSRGQALSPGLSSASRRSVRAPVPVPQQPTKDALGVWQMDGSRCPS
jgi:hypothetical protein